MEKSVNALEEKMQEFLKDAKDQAVKGNKAAGMRARKTSLEIEKLLKQFRKDSIEAAK